jgi:hypothetical protein
MFRPTLLKLALPLVILIGSIFPSFFIRQVVYGALAWPLGKLLAQPPFRFAEKPFLTVFGSITVGLVWAVLIYVIACLIGKATK